MVAEPDDRQRTTVQLDQHHARPQTGLMRAKPYISTDVICKNK